ncbi:MAG: LysR family transcriptional regulator, partial [Methylobacteriaceae bacterium]|nr:LysR family transcriptional regulator [Methylobacteriaceae bacterium]
MVGFRREMPSVTALVTFEAAARLRNFTRAAAELGVTQAAVSRQIRALEADLGGPLFRRLHRRVELTDNGAALATTLTRCLGQMSDAVRTVRQAHGGDELI